MVGGSRRVLRLLFTTKTGRHDITDILLKVALKHQKSKQSKSTEALSELCLTQCKQFLQLYHSENKLRFHAMLVDVFYQINTVSSNCRIWIPLGLLNNSPQLHTFSWFRAYQYLLSFLNAAFIADKQQKTNAMIHCIWTLESTIVTTRPKPYPHLTSSILP